MIHSRSRPRVRPLSRSRSRSGSRFRSRSGFRVGVARPLLAACTTGSLLLAFAAPATADVDNRASLKADLCYQLVTDRFLDGDPGNNNPSKSPGLYDSGRQNWKLYWGGDFAGIQQRLGYLADLGVTAIWMSPQVDNIDVAATYDGVPNAGYHGYWARDFFAPEEHFGTLADFDNLVSAAHAAGIKVIMDWAPNHTSPADPADPGFAEAGALYQAGAFRGDYLNDPNGYFHHNGGVGNWDDSYQTQYHNLFDLADRSRSRSTTRSRRTSATAST